MGAPTATHYQTAQLVPLFERMLRKCKLSEDESLVVLSDPDSKVEYAAAMYAAGRALGADVVNVMLAAAAQEQVPVIRTGNVSSTVVASSKLGLEILKLADMVVDLTFGGLLHSQEQRKILESGTRMLMVHDPPEALERMFPTDENRARVERSAERMRQATRIRLESDGGTDVWFDKTDRPVMEQYGWTDQPGRWDHWPSAFQYTIPTEGIGEGTLVLDPGDIWYPPKTFVSAPVTLRFDEGRVVAIEGGHDAFLIRDYIEGWQDPEGYAISHLGWGSHPAALWNSIAFQDPLDIIGQDGRTAYGTTLIALGENATWGGKQTTGCHQDFALRHHRFYLDDELIADSGRILPADLQ
jgi:2,5-dihydroxypyridine 5,6-dioxygenase